MAVEKPQRPVHAAFGRTTAGAKRPKSARVLKPAKKVERDPSGAECPLRAAQRHVEYYGVAGRNHRDEKADEHLGFKHVNGERGKPRAGHAHPEKAWEPHWSA